MTERRTDTQTGANEHITAAFKVSNDINSAAADADGKKIITMDTQVIIMCYGCMDRMETQDSSPHIPSRCAGLPRFGVQTAGR